jgi:hypothetical protein
MIKTNYNQLPLVILPCSAEKLNYPAKAVNFYLGKGYLPVLKNKKTIQLGRDYNLAFMSAKHGLVLSDEVLSPYDLKMTAKQADCLVTDKSCDAQDKLKQLDPSWVIACLPRLYLSTFERMTHNYEPKIDVKKPEKGSGIGLQRQFLSRALDKIDKGLVSFFVFHNLNSKQETVTTVIEACVGDEFTPYLGGVGENRCIGESVKIKQILVKNDLPIIVDEHDHKHSLFDVSNGLSEQQRQAAAAYGGFYEPDINMVKITVSLSQINRDVLSEKQKVARIKRSVILAST